MIGNDIINTIGSGSGINSSQLINDLVTINDLPQEQRLDSREALLDAQISDYGLLRSALSTLESSIAQLSSPDTFDAKAVSVPDTSLLALTKLESSAAAGNYQIKVEQVAQSQSLSSAGYATADAEIGTGELTLRFGAWNGALDTFAVDAEKTGASIIIDETNNTLAGLRDAINGADIGVQASVVSDGGQYRLLLTSPSGATNELEISVAEDGNIAGLSDFAFTEVSQSLTQQQEGLNARLRVNGLQVERDSNNINDVIQGLEFDIFSASVTETVSISISADRSLAETGVRDFVAAYNTFLAETEKLVGYNEDSAEYGSLRNDSLANNLVDSVRNFIGAAVPGIGDGFTNLANLGIQTKLDGTLEINEDPERANTNFTAAMGANFDLVKALFTPSVSSDSSKIEVTGFSAQTSPGDYEVVITQHATKGELTGTAAAGFPLDTTGKDYSFDIAVNGVDASITLPDGVIYNSLADVATEIQSLINLDANIQQSRSLVSVTVDGGALSFVSDTYGKDSKIAIKAVGADTADLGLQVATGTNGLDVAGTVDGVAAFGFGNVLLPAINTNAEGLKFIIKDGATTANINFSRGFAGGMSSLINNYLDTKGLIAERETKFETDRVDIADDRTEVERRSDAYRARLESQFLAMELIVNNLNNTKSFLDGINDRLPFTSQN
ncbi:flagellar filament capping protein FliD [Gilvimarinus polysaccharolyticus]|uniref:flagellar filament capping protein FliD n=1 Tax=Gilvimarinus polysaccharolyticus TaxID=863921 RepID=UPI0006733F72|nr:flagellar filament capping protein FliD [Gilvimarinus polysaccharolyticus]